MYLATVVASAHGLRSQGNDMECSGSLTESEGRLCLAGTIGNCSISANVAVTGDTLHIFTDVSRKSTVLDTIVSS